jgi:hypothetical protein
MCHHRHCHRCPPTESNVVRPPQPPPPDVSARPYTTYLSASTYLSVYPSHIVSNSSTLYTSLPHCQPRARPDHIKRLPREDSHRKPHLYSATDVNQPRSCCDLFLPVTVQLPALAPLRGDSKTHPPLGVIYQPLVVAPWASSRTFGITSCRSLHRSRRRRSIRSSRYWVEADSGKSSGQSGSL